MVTKISSVELSKVQSGTQDGSGMADLPNAFFWEN